MLRICGIAAAALGCLMLLQGLVVLLTPNSPDDVANGAAEIRRMDAFFPGASLAVIGFAILIWTRKPPVIDAIPADQKISIALTPDAAAFAIDAIKSRGYPPGSGLRIADTGPNAEMIVQFDIPSDRADDWLGEDRGVPVFVEGRLVDAVFGKTIGLQNEKLILRT